MSNASPPSSLWPSDADLAARLAELAKTGLPLPEGLEALAAEVPRRLQRPLQQLAERIRRGAPMEEALRGLAHLPEPLGAMLQAGIAQGHLPEVLEQYAQMERTQVEIRQRIGLCLAYPMLLMSILTALAFLGNYYMVTLFEEIYNDFSADLPMLTRFLLATSWWIPWIFVFLLLLLIAIRVVLSGMPVVRRLSPLVYYLPVFGAMMRTLRMANLTRWMTLFLGNGAPLPQALRWTATGLNDVYYSSVCRRIAVEVEQGRPVSDAALGRLPPALVSSLEWGRHANALPDAFQAAAEMYEGRARIRGTMTETILTPAFLILLMICISFWIIGLMLPLIELINHLAGAQLL